MWSLLLYVKFSRTLLYKMQLKRYSGYIEIHHWSQSIDIKRTSLFVSYSI